MKDFLNPEIEFVKVNLQDVICVSNGDINVTDKPGDGVIDNWIT